MKKRKLGKSGIEVSALGLGCWAIGGPFILDNMADGWGQIDDKESIRAIHCALELGVNFIDTADCYGVGHSEEVIGRALEGKRDGVVIATKFAFFGNEATKTLHGVNLSPDYIERACEASLERLRIDYIDLYQLHQWNISIAEVDPILDTLDRLVQKGKIRTYGWSTDLVNGARLFSQRENCRAIQHCMNIFQDAPDMIEFCEQNDLASITRSPLAMGFLTGKFNSGSFVARDDVRGAGHSWVPFFKDGRPDAESLKRLDSIRQILTSDGRTLTQGAISWLWARSGKTIPIPGFKNVKQVEENAGALEKGPLSSEQMKEIEKVLER
ncbi:MAG: aldo/keto reductase [Spirochaetes bacterium]|jgi:aryl-alcohol dehydrogenase-like predicted oxidoreductase|nr:aldo/keto reductase [Spirochaetota bacterium]